VRVHAIRVGLVGILDALVLAHERVAAHTWHRRGARRIIEQIEVELVPKEVYLVIGGILPKVITRLLEFGRARLSLLLFL